MTDDATLAAILTISALVPFSERGMAIYEIDGVAPQLAASAWVAASAQVMGRVLLGADASVWFGAVIRGGTESITGGGGAGGLVSEGREFPDGSMIIGCPAQAVRALTPEQIEGLRQSAQHYIDNARRFQSSLHAIG